MSQVDISSPVFKQTLKEVLVETLREERDLFQDVFMEALEDVTMAGAIRRGLETEPVAEKEIMKLLEDEN